MTELDPYSGLREDIAKERKTKILGFQPVDVVNEQLVTETPDLISRREWNRRIAQNPSLAKEYNLIHGLDGKLGGSKM